MNRVNCWVDVDVTYPRVMAENQAAKQRIEQSHPKT